MNNRVARAATAAKTPNAATDAVKENVKYHAAKSTSALPIEFGVPQMYQAVAQSVREGLVDCWNDTYAHFHKENRSRRTTSLWSIYKAARSQTRLEICN